MAFNYTVADFLPFTKIISADMNSRFNQIRSKFNWDGTTNTTGIDDSSIQSNTVSGGGLTRGTKLKVGTANYVVINSGTGAMSEEASLGVSRGGLGQDFSADLASSAGLAVVVNNAGNAFDLGSPLQSTLTESLAPVVSSLTAGEAIAIRDACCIDLSYDASGNDIYRIFRADYTKPNRRRSYLGFAQAAATVTPGIYTWVASANFVASNVITFSINNRAYSVPFTTDNATTLQAVATAMATDQDVNGAVSNASHTVTVTGKGALFLNIDDSLVTGGVSQPVITVNNTQAPVGQNVLVQVFGPLAGFGSLITGYQYFEDTAGSITETPTDTAPVQVGQAISSDVLFVNSNITNFQFGSPTIYIRSHGSSDGNATASGTSGVADSEHFNFVSWSVGATAPVARYIGSGGDTAYNGLHHAVSGYYTGGNIDGGFYSYNKAAWSILTNKPTAVLFGTAYAYNTFLYGNCGATANSAANRTAKAEKWNGASWATATDWAFALFYQLNFSANALLTISGGYVAGAATNQVSSARNSADTLSVPASLPVVGTAAGGSTLGLTGMVVSLDDSADTTDSYTFNGSSWSSMITAAYSQIGDQGSGSASSFSRAISFTNGGQTASTSGVVNTSQTFNGTGFAVSTSSTNSRGNRPASSVI